MADTPWERKAHAIAAGLPGKASGWDIKGLFDACHDQHDARESLLRVLRLRTHKPLMTLHREWNIRADTLFTQFWEACTRDWAPFVREGDNP